MAFNDITYKTAVGLIGVPQKIHAAASMRAGVLRTRPFLPMKLGPF